MEEIAQGRAGEWFLRVDRREGQQPHLFAAADSPSLAFPRAYGIAGKIRSSARALKPAPEEALREWKVSPRLNHTGVGDDDLSIIEPMRAV